MGKIGGNISAVIQTQTITQNDIGEDVSTWVDALPPFVGWLDLSGGDSDKVNYNTKIQESTHVFVCDYFPLVTQGEEPGKEITPENSRMIVNGKVYEVKLYDNPMELNSQLEIYLKYVGGA